MFLICYSSILDIIYKVVLMMQTRLTLRLRYLFTPYPKDLSLKSTQSTFHTSQLTKELRKDLLELPKFSADVLLFGRHHSDHLVEVPYDTKNGWGKPILKPFGPIPISPFASSLHYGIQCFQGLKAYKDTKGKIRLFRPECNAMRLKRSSVRLTLPDFDGEQLINLIKQFVLIQQRWIPPITEFSLYLRPLHISVDNTLGVKKPEKSKLFVMGGPVGPYYPTGFKPISLSCRVDTIRSAPKGTGAYKIGGNYAPTLAASSSVISEGFQQVLWLYNDQIVQVGASNIFFIFKDKSGQIEVVTPDLQDLILPGVTRDSILVMLRDQKKYKVTERKVFITQLIDRHRSGELIQCFGAGTAVILGGIKQIEYKGIRIKLLNQKQLIGPISRQIRDNLLNIQEGRLPDRYGWIRQLN